MTADFGSRGYSNRPGVWPGRVALGIGALIVFLWAFGAAALAIGKATGDGMRALGPGDFLAVASSAGVQLGVGTAVICGVLFLFFTGPSGRPGRTLRYVATVLAAGVVGLFACIGAFGMAQPSIAADKQVEAVVAAHKRQMEADEKAMMAELAEAGVTPTDTTASIGRNLAAASRAVEAAHEIIDRYETLRETRVKQARDQVAKLAASDGRRARYLDEIDRGWAESRKLLDRRWALERRSLGVREELIDLLKRTRGHWQASGDMLLFARQRDLDAAQALMTEMNNIERERRKLKYDLDVFEAKAKGEEPPPRPIDDLITLPPGTPVTPAQSAPRN